MCRVHAYTENKAQTTQRAQGHIDTYLHHDKEVKDQDERSKERSGNLITGQKSPVQFVPADPVSCDDKYHHGSQGKENSPAMNKTFLILTLKAVLGCAW